MAIERCKAWQNFHHNKWWHSVNRFFAMLILFVKFQGNNYLHVVINFVILFTRWRYCTPLKHKDSDSYTWWPYTNHMTSYIVLLRVVVVRANPSEKVGLSLRLFRKTANVETKVTWAPWRRRLPAKWNARSPTVESSVGLRPGPKIVASCSKNCQFLLTDIFEFCQCVNLHKQ